MLYEERDDIIILVDDNGEEAEFEYIDTIEMNGNEYVVLAPLQDGDLSDQDEDDEEEEIIILKVERNENGEESYVAIEDDDELDAVFEEIQARIDEEYEEEE